MGTYRLETPRIELSLELFGRKPIRAGQLDIFETKVAHLVERSRHILRELRTQAIKLQANRALETLRLTRRRGVGRKRETEQGNAHEGKNEYGWFYRHLINSRLAK